MKTLTSIAAALAIPILAAAASGTPQPGRVSRAPGPFRAGSRDANAAPLVHARQQALTVPLTFEANAGQSDPQVRFLARTANSTLFFTANEAVLALGGASGKEVRGKGQGATVQDSALKAGDRSTPSAVLRMHFAGGNPNPCVVARDQQPGRINYFLGSDPARWRRNIATYARVCYEQVYPGVDLVYYGNQRRLEYDLIVAPGADPRRVRLAFRGAEQARIDAAGDLVLSTPAGEVRQPRPVIYQQVGGRRREVAGGYVLSKGSSGEWDVAFQLGAYDARSTLVIDPQLVASTLLGGSGDDLARGVAVDADGNAYLGGVTTSSDFPGSGFRSPPGPPRAFYTYVYAYVAKFNPEGTQLLYASIIGGMDQGGGDEAEGVAVDPDGNAWVGGWTTSHDFPTTSNALLPAYPGGTFYLHTTEGFLAKLSADGSQLLYSTYFGGNNDNGVSGDPTQIFALATGLGGRVYITGATLAWVDPSRPGSEGIPVKNAPQPALAKHNLDPDAFVASFDPNGALIYSTYLGGSDPDFGLGIAVGATGVACVMGQTWSHLDPQDPLHLPFPTTPGALQTGYGGNGDAFVTSVAAPGGVFNYSTYLGGSDQDAKKSDPSPPSGGVAVDPEGNVYVAGWTQSPDFPTTDGAFQTTFHGKEANSDGGDVFVTKIRPDAQLPVAQQLLYSTFLGAPGPGQRPKAIAVDSQLNAYVVGFTGSASFPTVNGFPVNSDAFLSVLNSTGSGLIYSTRLGAPLAECNGVALGVFGDIYVGGYVAALPGFTWPTTDNAYQNQTQAHIGTDESFLMRIRISESDIQVSSCSVNPTFVPAAGGPVTISAAAASKFGIQSVTAHILHPKGPEVVLPLPFDPAAGKYTAVFNAPAATSVQPEAYTVSVVATDRADTQVSAACGTFTVGAQKVVITNCQVSPEPVRRARLTVPITATVQSSEKIRAVLALVALQPGGPPVGVHLTLKKGLYQGTFRARANIQQQDRVYRVIIEATTRSGAQATKDCGAFTIPGQGGGGA